MYIMKQVEGIEMKYRTLKLAAVFLCPEYEG